jgi:polyhydroxybutyrate depolymerase
VTKKKGVAGLLLLLGIPLLVLGAYYWWGYSREEKITVGNMTRRYRIHLPLSRQSRDKIPLVVILHGYGDNPRLVEWYSGFSRKADRENFAVIYPYGTASKVDTGLSWNAGLCCASALTNRIDDATFVNQVVKEVIEKYNLDRTRVYMGGFSNGAMMAGILVNEFPNTFAAAGIVSGSTGGQSPGSQGYFRLKSPAEPMPVILFHGDKDVAVPYGGGVNRYYKIPALASFDSFPDSVNYWLKGNQCRNQEKQKLSTGVEILTGSNCMGDTEVRAYSIPDRGHVWFGSLVETAIYGQNKGISATDLMWDFFQKYTI